ncbi:MAG: hypothetical protein R2867_46550 [Caldilineaceae bacterium]
MPLTSHFHDAAQLMLSLANGCGVLGDVSYFMPNSMGYTLPLYWRMTFWGRSGVVETAITWDHMMVALDGEEQPRHEPLPAGNPGGYLQAFLDDVAGKPAGDRLHTQLILDRARVALQIQAAASSEGGQTTFMKLKGFTIAVTDVAAMVRFYNAVFGTNLQAVEAFGMRLYRGELAGYALTFCPNSLLAIKAEKNRQQLSFSLLISPQRYTR